MKDSGFESVPGAGGAAPLVLTVNRALRYAGELAFTASDGSAASVLLDRRYARVFLVLISAWHEDTRVCASWRGFRERHVIGATMGDMPASDGPVRAATVKHYVCAIRRIVREALHAPDPIETRRDFGYRIGEVGVTIAWEGSHASTLASTSTTTSRLGDAIRLASTFPSIV